MRYYLIDDILERSADRIVAIKHLSRSEPYLQDHFPAFPIMPGVLMLEALVQAARALLADRGDPRLVLGAAKAVKYGAMVRPGDTLRVEVELTGSDDDEQYVCRGHGRVISGSGTAAEPQTAVRGRFTMRPIRRPDYSLARLDGA